MKKLLLKFFFFLYRSDYYKPLSKDEVEGLLLNLANKKEMSRLPDYLKQCADNAKNQYLYSNDEIFKGVVLAFTTLREQIVEAKVKPEKKLL